MHLLAMELPVVIFLMQVAILPPVLGLDSIQLTMCSTALSVNAGLRCHM
jgi:hypothetical protein